MKVYLTTRFSIFDTKYNGFRIKTKNDTETYKKKLFCEKRLDQKFALFEMMTLPSILNQTYTNWEWNIFTSVYLPQNYKDRLLNLTQDNEKIKIHFIASFKEFKLASLDKEIDYCTVRIDDDDGLNTDFFQNLQQYKEKKNVVVLHSNGICFKLKNGNVVLGESRSWNTISLGACAIGFDIYSCGNHNSIHKRYTVINDETPDMWYLAYSKYCDSGRRKFPSEKI